MNLAEIGEFGLISHLQNRLEKRVGTQVSIGDDCAILNSLQTPVVTMDSLVEGVHFRRDWTSPRVLGRKAMAVNISDLASSGARPVAAFVSLSLGARDDIEFVEQLYAGFEDVAHEFNFTIAGGDTTKSLGDLVLSITLIGEVINHQRGPVLRSGARDGDILLASGFLGDAAAGLKILLASQAEMSSITADASSYLLKRHHEPSPRLKMMEQLLQLNSEAIHAALDLSDGLVGDAAHLARSANVKVEIDVSKLPISPFCHEVAPLLKYDALDLALSGGEDYELLLAVAPERALNFVNNFRDEDVSLSEIGVCGTMNPDSAKPPVVLLDNGKIRESKSSWTHF